MGAHPPPPARATRGGGVAQVAVLEWIGGERGVFVDGATAHSVNNLPPPAVNRPSASLGRPPEFNTVVRKGSKTDGLYAAHVPRFSHCGRLPSPRNALCFSPCRPPLNDRQKSLTIKDYMRYPKV